MSYILDALKKSDQERQQGNPPNLHSIHVSQVPATPSSSLRQNHSIWLIFCGIFITLCCLGTLLFIYRQNIADTRSIIEKEPLLSADAAKLPTKPLPPQEGRVDNNGGTSPPQVIIKEKQQVVRSIAVKNTPAYPQTNPATDSVPSSVPLLSELPAQLQAEIPTLHFAGHTYSEEPSQRMIIVNGRILREGDMIEPNTYLTEITWEGVVVAFMGTRFRVKTD